MWMPTMMFTILDKISDFYFRLFGGTSLGELEKLCLDAWRETLNARDRTILDEQLEKVVHIQHQAGGAKVVFFYDNADIPLFPDRSSHINVATVVLESASAPGERMKVKLFTTRGHFFSIEFPKRPERYIELHGMDAASIRVQTVINHPAPDPALSNTVDEP
jgi:hypothetical protein